MVAQDRKLQHREHAKDHPTIVVEVVLLAAAVEEPDDVLEDVERAVAVAAGVVDILTEKVVVHVLLEITDSLGEEARTDEKDEVGHDDEESADRRARSEGIDEEAD